MNALNNQNTAKKGLWVLILFTIFPFAINAQGSGFGTAESCNVNAVCEPDFCNQRRSIGLIYKLENGVYKRTGTGSLITNERRDGRPYFLTANHIVDINKDNQISSAEQEIIDNLMVVFNYQSIDCSPNTPSIEPDTTAFVIIGATLRAHNTFGDFALLELNTRLPGNFNVFYNGFSNVSTKPNNITMIHHPKGDIKKISKSNQEPTKPFGTGSWKVTEWTSGTSESGSSGAPWFNQDKLVVGQQSQNDNNNQPCTNNLKSFGGRMDKHWDENSAVNKQLKHWLNPNGTSNTYILSMSGDEPCKESIFFENANDLHTSSNVIGIPPYSGPLAGTRSYDGVYLSSGLIEAGMNVSIQDGTSVEFHGETVILSPGFMTEEGSYFLAEPNPCLGGCGHGRQTNADEEITYFNNGELYSKEKIIGSTININSQDYQDSETISDKIHPSIFSLFPNPTQSHLSVASSHTFQRIILFNLLGEKVLEYNQLNHTQFECNLQSLSNGIYMVLVEMEDAREIRKVIVARE